MAKTSELLRENRKREIWTKHCGFLNLTTTQFMEIQKRLLYEQLDLLKGSVLGKELFGESVPSTLEEFRQTVPLTTYEDYAKYLDEKNEDVLPVKPYMWARTSGRSSVNGHKWVPYTKQMYDILANVTIGAMILSSCSQEGDVRLERLDKLLLATAPPPYMSGLLSYSTQDQLDIRFLPSLNEADQMEFSERIAQGFRLAMKEGLDYFYGIASVLAAMGERFESDSNGSKPSRDMLNPVVLWRLLKALFVTKVNNRKMLPKDIWKVKGICTGGTDAEIYGDKIEYYWGKKPLVGYGITEGGTMAMQGWNFNGMVFFPDSAFLEFIPMKEFLKEKENPGYEPETVLLDELEVGVYELAFTNFHGGTFVRYRPGDMFEVISIGDDDIRSELPQFKFYSRSNMIIDLGGFARLTETDIWKSIEGSGFPYHDWVARKEIVNQEPILHLYIEPKPNQAFNEADAKEKIDFELQKQVPEYQDLKNMLKKDPLHLAILPHGAFSSYMQFQQEAGADLAHVKPPHMQPADEIMERLRQP